MSVSRRHWVIRVALAVSVWLVVLGVATGFGMTFRPTLLALAIAAGAGVVWLFLDASAIAMPSYWEQESLDPVRTPGEDSRLSALSRHIAHNLDAKDFSERLYDDLVAVADERLMARHGLSRIADPERAAAVFGPDLARFVSRPPGSRPRLGLGEVDVVLNRIESL